MSSPSPEAWRSLPSSVEPADQQLAAGDALLVEHDHPGEPLRPALRWYRMQPRALILGSGQKLSEFDLQACRRAGIALHRRSSGGTAVLAEPDQLMLDIALPASHRLYRHDVTESYRWLGEVWVEALALLGVSARIIPVAEARADRQHLDDLTRRSCYGGRSPYEVLADGRKVLGLAQVRRRYGALLQASVYMHWQPEQLAALFALPSAAQSTLAAQLAERVVGLADVLPPDPQHSEDDLFKLVCDAVAIALRDTQGVLLVHDEWTPQALETRRRTAARYAAINIEPDEEWIGTPTDPDV
jgi:lipoate-protein ligase A